MRKRYMLTAIVVAVFIFWNLGTVILQNSNETTHTGRVTDKVRVSYGHIWNTHKFLIFTIDDETNTVRVFENTDSLPYGKFNSADHFARIEVGKTYNFRVVGFRLPFLSMFKNIIEATPVEPG